MKNIWLKGSTDPVVFVKAYDAENYAVAVTPPLQWWRAHLALLPLQAEAMRLRRMRGGRVDYGIHLVGRSRLHLSIGQDEVLILRDRTEWGMLRLDRLGAEPQLMTPSFEVSHNGNVVRTNIRLASEVLGADDFVAAVDNVLLPVALSELPYRVLIEPSQWAGYGTGQALKTRWLELDASGQYVCVVPDTVRRVGPSATEALEQEQVRVVPVGWTFAYAGTAYALVQDDTGVPDVRVLAKLA